MLRRTVLALSRSDRVRDALTSLPLTRDIVSRYVPGERTEDAVRVVGDLVGDGLTVTLDLLGEDVRDRAQAARTVADYQDLLQCLAERDLAGRAEVSVKLSAVGQALPGGGEQVALEHARAICRAARRAGTAVTLDMEDHTTTASTLRVLRQLRKDYPETGAVLQSYLHRTEADCADLATPGSRVRLCKGAYREPPEVAHQDRLAIDTAYVRCLRTLMEGEGYPMVATHDPRLVDIALALARQAGRRPGSFEFQMLYGIRPEEQRRLAAAGHTVRVYVPYGEEWYGYLVRRLAERPSNLAFFARSLLSRR